MKRIESTVAAHPHLTVRIALEAGPRPRPSPPRIGQSLVCPGCGQRYHPWDVAVVAHRSLPGGLQEFQFACRLCDRLRTAVLEHAENWPQP